MINNYDSVVSQNSSGATIFQKSKATSYSFGNRNWFSFVLTFLMLFSFVFVQGQSTANYTFTYGPSILNSMSGSTPVPGIAAYPADSGASTILPIGFNFTYMGTNYSHFNVNTDGQVRLHTSGSGTAMGNSVSGYSASTVTLAPMGGDNETGTGISYLVTGTAPNRKLIIEWNNFYAHWTDPQTSGNMQLVLNEGSGVFEFIYGGIKNSNSTSTTRSIFHSSSNTTNSSAFITVGATPTQNTTATSPTTNSFAASVLIANLANTFYKFTPASTVEAPTALTFSGVTSAGTTVNWVDNSTTEYGFLVTRATDAGFTSGVVTSTVASTTAAATGQAYASVQTGLLPSTTYYYKVQALSEIVTSSDISGSQATIAPGTFISVATGNYGSASTWDANSVPTLYDTVVISTGHVVTIDAAGQSLNNLTVNGTLTYGATPTSFSVLGNLTVNAGGLVNVFNGTTGKTLTVAGNITNNGTMDFSVGATTAGNLTLNGTAVQMVSGTGSFNTSVIRNLIFSNTATVTPNIVWSFNNIKIAYNLNLTGARVDLGANKLIFGNAAAGNTLTAPVGTGFLPGATFARWWSTASTGTPVTAGSDPTNSTSRYPFITSTGVQRAMYISRTGSTSGNVAGELAVTYTDAASMTTGLSVVDGTYTITDRFDGKWTITKDGTYSHVGAHTVVALANNVYFPSNGNSRLMLANAPLAGTHQNGTITPGAQRVGLTTAQLIAGDIYMGINAADIPFISVANGNWDTASTWNKNAVPTASDVVYIANGTTVDVTSVPAFASSILVYSGGTLNVSGSTLSVTTTLTNNGTVNTNSGDLIIAGGTATGISNTSTGTFVVAGGTVTLGPSGGGNRLLSNAGTLTVSGGILTINGQLSVTNTFNQSGGAIIVDGNAAGVVANSVASSAGSFSYSGSIVFLGTNLLNLTGGTLIVVDPHAGSSTTYDMALAYSSGSSVTLGTGHTVQFGDGLSTDSGGHTNGFFNYLYVGLGYLSYGNLAINIEPGTNRFYKSTSTIGVLGNLNIIKGEHQLASTTHVAGNIINNTRSAL